jgi:hypothetical protein
VYQRFAGLRLDFEVDGGGYLSQRREHARDDVSKARIQGVWLLKTASASFLLAAATKA